MFDASRFSKRRSGIVLRQRLRVLSKEVFRKSIHLCSAFIPFFLSKAYVPVMILLGAAMVLYSVSEFVRLSGKEVFLISAITEAAARKRDENRFVLGPVTLTAGIMTASLLWQPLPAAIGIYALAFGDGLASLSGKLFGRVQIPCTEGNTAAGSLTCFGAIFTATYLALCFSPAASGCPDIALVALKIATAGMLIEVLPLRDLDNIVIPVVLGGLAQLQLFAM